MGRRSSKVGDAESFYGCEGKACLGAQGCARPFHKTLHETAGVALPWPPLIHSQGAHMCTMG